MIPYIQKTNKVIVKLYNTDNSFIKSVIIPTERYPVDTNFQCFDYSNTEKINDKHILDIFDSIDFEIGYCYTNTEKLVHKLKENGYNAVSYVGWLFVGNLNPPIHHCWTVLDDKYVLDYSDYMNVLDMNQKNFIHAKTKEEARFLLQDFMKHAKTERNSIVCQPVGKVYQDFLYVGSPCSPHNGRLIYQNLERKYNL